MSLSFDKMRASSLLKREAELATQENVNPEWTRLVEQLSQACQRNKTHIAFLGTAMLAKALNLQADVFAVKEKAGTPGAYSARGLGHGVLVAHALELGINLGTTGREPLNNQPYFRIQRVDRSIPVHGSARPVVDLLLRILERLDKVQAADEARRALRSFIYVRRQHQPKYLEVAASRAEVSTEQLIRIVERFVAEDSEGGRRAQAVVAGLMDLFAGPERVEAGRINDPDRHVPGDVGVRSEEDPERWERLLEVRDKPVAVSDAFAFAKALEAGVEEAAIVAVASGQVAQDFHRANEWAAERGLALFIGWRPFIEQALFWSEQPQTKGPTLVMPLIYERLIEVEVSEKGANAWLSAMAAEG
jgi:SacI restriction endonuclease